MSKENKKPVTEDEGVGMNVTSQASVDMPIKKKKVDEGKTEDAINALKKRMNTQNNTEAEKSARKFDSSIRDTFGLSVNFHLEALDDAFGGAISYADKVKAIKAYHNGAKLDKKKTSTRLYGTVSKNFANYRAHEIKKALPQFSEEFVLKIVKVLDKAEEKSNKAADYNGDGKIDNKDLEYKNHMDYHDIIRNKVQNPTTYKFIKEAFDMFEENGKHKFNPELKKLHTDLNSKIDFKEFKSIREAFELTEKKDFNPVIKDMDGDGDIDDKDLDKIDFNGDGKVNWIDKAYKIKYQQSDFEKGIKRIRDFEDGVNTARLNVANSTINTINLNQKVQDEIVKIIEERINNLKESRAKFEKAISDVKKEKDPKKGITNAIEIRRFENFIKEIDSKLIECKNELKEYAREKIINDNDVKEIKNRIERIKKEIERENTAFARALKWLDRKTDDIFIAAYHGVAKGIVSADKGYRAAKDFATEKGKEIKKGFKSAFDSAKSAASDAGKSIKQGASNAFKSIKSYAKFWEHDAEAGIEFPPLSLDEAVTINKESYFEQVVAIINQNFSHCVNELEIDEDGTITFEMNGKNEYITFCELVDKIPEIEFVDADVIGYTKSAAHEQAKTFSEYVKMKQAATASNDDDLDDDDKLFFDGIDDDIDEVELKELPQNTLFSVFVYPYPEAAILSAEIDADTVKRYDESIYYDDHEKLEEVRRMWKVNAKGKKRLKMKCKPGFKWTGTACMKISGADLAQSRIAKRKMVRSKKAKGDALKRKTLRLTRKARRHRKNFGLK